MKKLTCAVLGLVLLVLLAICVSPVFARLDLPRPRPTIGSGSVSFYDVAFGINAKVTFMFKDDNMHPHGDQIALEYSDSAGHSFTLGSPLGIYPWNSTNILGSVSSWPTRGVIAAEGKITSTSDSSWLVLDTLVLFTIYDSGMKGGGEDYIQMWIGMPYSGLPWDPIAPSGYPPTPNWPVTSGNIKINWSPA